MGFYLFGERARKMTVRQRAAGLIAACLSLANLTTTVALMLLPIVMLLGRPLIVTPNQQSLRMLLSMAIASIISEWLDDLIVSLITGYKIAMSEGHASYWMAPCKFNLAKCYPFFGRQLTVCSRPRSGPSRRLCAAVASAYSL